MSRQHRTPHYVCTITPGVDDERKLLLIKLALGSYRKFCEDAKALRIIKHGRWGKNNPNYRNIQCDFYQNHDCPLKYAKTIDVYIHLREVWEDGIFHSSADAAYFAQYIRKELELL